MQVLDSTSTKEREGEVKSLMAKILLVEDNELNRDMLSRRLLRKGFTLVMAEDGQQAVVMAEKETPDIILLDGNLPKVDGFEVCRRIRHASKTPIIMLTARDEEADVLRGLQVGADDYVTKPFSAKLLTARMRTVLRRYQDDAYRQPAAQVQVGDITLDLQSHEVTKGGAPVQRDYQLQPTSRTTIEMRPNTSTVQR